MNSVCREVVELLIDFVDGELPPDRREAFERHLCGCQPCFAYLDTYQAMQAWKTSLDQNPF